MRLDKYISEALGLTRSQSRELIRTGRVQVAGQVCKRADAPVEAQTPVTADGSPLQREEFVYLMVNKPQGVVSASTDRRDKTVVDLVGDAFPRRQLFPAGRLDKTSTGFVLLTDDGSFAHEILSPARHVSKTYAVLLDTPVTPEMVRGFAQGVTLADGQVLRGARLVPDPDQPCRCTVVLTQGVYHQIKRMFGVYGAGVNGLHRLAIGGLRLCEALAPGEWKKITPQELEQLKRDEAPDPARSIGEILEE